MNELPNVYRRDIVGWPANRGSSSIRGSIPSSVFNYSGGTAGALMHLFDSYDDERGTNQSCVKIRSLSDKKSMGKIRNSSEPAQHVAFLKVHMAGSSSIQSMLFRYGYERNLSFVLPSQGHYITKSPGLPEPLLPPRHGSHYDVICNHACFNYSLYSAIMPSDTIYLAVVRDPYQQFLHSYYYYLRFFKFAYLANIPQPAIENLINFPEKYDEGNLSYTMNAIARDFGFQNHHFNDYTPGSRDTPAHAYLQEIANVFDLVLLFEKYEESLVLMKRLLNWSLKDILFVPEKEEVPDVKLLPDLLNKFKRRNRLDYLVYDYFSERTGNRIREGGTDLVEEAQNFKLALKTVRMWCSYQYFGTLTIPATKWNHQFQVTSTDCAHIGLSEFDYMDLLKSHKND